MSIRIEEAEDSDLAEVATTEPLPLSTPGEILRREFLEPLGLSANALAAALRVPANRSQED